MEKAPAFIATITGIAALALLAACSGTQGSALRLPVSGMSQIQVPNDLARSGLSPKFFGFVRPRSAGNVVSPARAGGELFVSDSYYGKNAIDVLSSKHWRYVTDITDDIGGPDGNWFANGEFYVANYKNVSITEYSSPTTLTYTYDAGMTDPIDVTVDSHGNVYEADYDCCITNGSRAGFINEYRQQSNSVTATCNISGYVEGVAVDKHGDVFADYNDVSYGLGEIIEFKGGLSASSCDGTLLPVGLGFAGGMAFDKHGNLLVCDQDARRVDIIKPPYTRVSRRLGSGLSDPFHVTINEKNTQAYVATIYGGGEVYVLSYPSGKSIARLGASNGISDAWAAVDRDNYVP